MTITSPYIKPGILEVYCGPMKSGKSKRLFDRFDKLKFIDNCNILFIKPKLDTRNDNNINSRYQNSNMTCYLIDINNFTQLENLIETNKINVLFIDEVQLFNKNFKDTIIKLLKNNIHIIAAGIDLDFRGETFGFMSQILPIANRIYKLTAVCEVKNCFLQATRSQRLINGKPAKYDEPIISIESNENNEKYEPRCLKHFIIEKN